MLTSSSPTNRKTSSFADVTSIAPALMNRSEPKNSGALASSTWSCAIASSKIPVSRKNSRP